MTITENNEIRDILERLMSGNATDEELSRLLNWSKASPDNSRQLLAIIGLEDLVSSSFSPEDIDSERAKTAIRAKIQAKKKRRTGVFMARAAAVLALPLLVFSLWLGQRNEAGKDTFVAQQTIQTPLGSRNSITLPDGSLVVLNSASSISFPSEFKDDVREVTLEGEGYFEVHSDKQHPFVVHSGDISVTAIGTKFNVNTYSSNASVALLEGKVGVEVGKSSTSLAPGQILKRTGEEILVEEADIELICGWKDGIISFRDDSMAYVLERLGLIYGVEFEIKDQAICDYMFRGTFEGKTLDQILGVIEMSIPVKFSDDGFIGDQHLRHITVSLSK